MVEREAIRPTTSSTRTNQNDPQGTLSEKIRFMNLTILDEEDGKLNGSNGRIEMR